MNCKQCGEPIKPRKGRITSIQPGQRFYSRKCGSASRKKTITLICTECRQPFPSIPSRSHLKYCSKACQFPA